MVASRRVVEASVYILVILLIVCGCGNDSEKYEWWSQIQFVDSTYTFKKSEYNIGDMVYILFTGDYHFGVPETIAVEIRSNLGDYEPLPLLPSCEVPESLVNPRIGEIKTRGASECILRNHVLEVRSDYDTIIVFSGSRTFPGEDTAYIRRIKRGYE